MPTDKVSIIVLSAITSMLYMGVTMAEETENAGEVQALKDKIELLNKETELLKAEKLRLEAQKSLAEAKAEPSAEAQEIEQIKKKIELLTEQKNLVNTYAPSLPKGLEGSISLDENQSIEAIAVAYRTMRKLAPTIAERLKKRINENAQILLLTDIDKNALAARTLFNANLKLLINAYEEHLPEEQRAAGIKFAPAALLAGAGTIVKTASDLMALFRTDTELKTRTVTISDKSLVAEFANAFSDRVVYCTEGFPAWASETSKIIEQLELLNNARQDARSRHQKWLDDIKNEAAGAKNDKDRPATIADQERIEAQWTDLESSSSALTKSLRERDTATGVTPLEHIARGHWLHGQLSDTEKQTVGLSLKVLYSGGTYVLKKTFFSGTTMRQSGGIVIEYLLFDKSGRILAAGTADEVREFPDLTIQQ